ncbi:fructosamine kinase family protein [Marinobacter sp. CA1]|uniref:fructosamine kinase family protein n=1 Tax=Marinobacter sp. CA1 TaxID=2817656 RepID=UPI001D06A9ED|nr:fructosamine kinase family protein [Marinobacter sp. CA1]UDL05310.1 fructosamine kinase family protein [Marinobacter sp. CA1]
MSLHRKANQTTYDNALQVEAEGLERLRQALAGVPDARVRIPVVHRVDQHSLLLDRIDAGPGSETQMAELGRDLAGMHRLRQPYYGLDHDNYIGLAPQRNDPDREWGRFFLDRRLGDQLARITEAAVKAEFEAVIRRQRDRLRAFLNDHCPQPSLLHGDLWSGNVLCDATAAWLIDPAVYYGDREADLAMTEFFGGFPASFYHAYDQAWARTGAYPVKRDIYNLYHALNHYNLFGAGYLGSCRRALAVIEGL